MNAKMKAATAKMATKHLYGFENGTLVVRQPDNIGGHVYATIRGTSMADCAIASKLCKLADKALAEKAK